MGGIKVARTVAFRFALLLASERQEIAGGNTRSIPWRETLWRTEVHICKYRELR